MIRTEGPWVLGEVWHDCSVHGRDCIAFEMHLTKTWMLAEKRKKLSIQICRCQYIWRTPPPHMRPLSKSPEAWQPGESLSVVSIFSVTLSLGFVIQ